MSILLYKKLIPTAKDPVLAHPGTDFGYDVFSAEDETVSIEPGEQKLVRTGLAWELTPFEFTCKHFGAQLQVGVIAKQPSGIALKRMLDVKAGVIDAGYRNEVKILLYNYGKTTQSIEPGAKMAQVVPHIVLAFGLQEVQELSESDRGLAGWGSGKTVMNVLATATNVIAADHVEPSVFESKQEEMKTLAEVDEIFEANAKGEISDEECLKSLNEIREDMGLPPLES